MAPRLLKGTGRDRPEILGLITARGASKGLPRKNILPAGGRPLLAWTVEAALESRYISRVVLSTDDPEIARVGRAWGAETPFLRPQELARDDSPHTGVILHALEWLRDQEGNQPSHFAVLLPTAPLRTARDIDAACRLALERKADRVLGVCPSPIHPYFIKGLDGQGRLRDFLDLPEIYLRRQDLPPAYANFGTVNVTRTGAFLALKDWPQDRTLPYLMPLERCLDVDTAWDLHLADLVLNDRNRRAGAEEVRDEGREPSLFPLAEPEEPRSATGL
jgi:CMP-N,N'-diacetyllegionaminic acid synthase